jgi:medium-chain acyl-[acyl-carrier-protein] hydrolase
MTLHQEKYKIRGNETGPNFKITVPALAGFLQEAAWMHSMELEVSVYELLKKGLTWVLSRLIIEMDMLPKHNDEVTVVTWPSGFERHNIFRDYHLQDKDGQLIGKAKSVWVIMDLKSRQVIAPPPFITELTIQHAIPHVHLEAGKIPVSDSYANAKTFVANWFDIDINRHVNHISYIRWTIESAPPDILLGKEAMAIDIVFRAESEYGDDVVSLSQPVNEQHSMLLHKLVQKNTGRELSLAKTLWR